MGSHLLVQISDVHLTADGALSPGVRPRDNLLSGLRLLAAADIRPDVFLLTWPQHTPLPGPAGRRPVLYVTSLADPSVRAHLLASSHQAAG